MNRKSLTYAGVLCLCSGLLTTLGWPERACAQGEVGVNFTVAIPQDEFDEVTDTGNGLTLKGLFRLRNVPYVSLRADATFLTYQFGRYVERGFLVETRTQSVRLTVGPQFSVRARRFELYVSPMYGVYNFYTRDEILGYIFTRTRDSNTEFGWNVNGGLMIGVARLPERGFDLALDVGGSWHKVREGFVTEVDAEGETVSVKRDVKELCLHAGIILLFR